MDSTEDKVEIINTYQQLRAAGGGVAITPSYNGIRTQHFHGWAVYRVNAEGKQIVTDTNAHWSDYGKKVFSAHFRDGDSPAERSHNALAEAAALAQAARIESTTARDTRITTFPFTPGPWRYVPFLSGSENHKGFCVQQVGRRRGKYAVAEVYPLDQDGIEGQANARLIAAAPSLYKQLEKIYRDNEETCGCDCDTELCCTVAGAPCPKCDAHTGLALAHGQDTSEQKALAT
jgi:hypothetical protein